MKSVIEKLLLEDEFLNDYILHGEKILVEYDNLNENQQEQLLLLQGQIVSFFGGKEKVQSVFQDNKLITEQIAEYSKEKLTYLLASEESGQQQRIIWVLG